MNTLYQNLIERIRSEVTDLELVVERALQSWEAIRHVPPQERYAFIDSVALNLHSFYSGVERLFELVARQVDRNVPEGGAWHRDLLQ